MEKASINTDYLEIRCRCKKKKLPLECWSLLGGPSVNVLYSHDYSKSPYEDIRYCPECRRMIKITIPSLNDIPVIEALPKGSRLNFIKPEMIFKFIEVHR
jgi:hypothetical protein